MKLKCKFCGYEWDYQGKNDIYACCPRCHRSIKVTPNSKNCTPPASDNPIIYSPEGGAGEINNKEDDNDERTDNMQN